MIKYKIVNEQEDIYIVFNSDAAKHSITQDDFIIKKVKFIDEIQGLASYYHLIYQFDLLLDYLPMLERVIKDDNLDINYSIFNANGTKTNFASLLVKHVKEDAVELRSLFNLLIEKKINIQEVYCDDENIIEAIISQCKIFLLETLLATEYYHSIILSLMNIEENLEVYFHAAVKGYRSICKFFINNGIDINITTTQGATALHYLAYNGHEDLCQEFVELGADINSQDAKDVTPLHYAAKNGHLNVCIILKTLGANLNIIDKYGATAIHLASYEKHQQHIDIIKILACSENINIKDDRGATALHYAADEGHMAICKQLLELGIDINIQDNNLATALHYAADKRHINVSKLLIMDNKTDLNVQDKHFATALHYAASNGIVEIYQLLGGRLGEQKYFDTADDRGYTPLYCAVEGYQLALDNIQTNQDTYYDIILSLLQASAKVNIYDLLGNSLLTYVIVHCDYNLLSMILREAHDIEHDMCINATKNSIKYDKIQNAILLLSKLNAKEQNKIVIDALHNMELNEGNVPSLLNILVKLKDINQPDDENVLIASLLSENFRSSNACILKLEQDSHDIVAELSHMSLNQIEGDIEPIGSNLDDIDT